MHWSEEDYQQFLRRSQQSIDGPGATQDTPEKAFLAQVVRVARRQGYLVYHTHDSRRSAPGFPDVCIVEAKPGPGRCFLWECKTRTGKLSMDQQIWLRALDGKNVDARVVRPGDLEEIVKLLRQRG
jgi:hypothetical protein